MLSEGDQCLESHKAGKEETLKRFAILGGGRSMPHGEGDT